ncbi:MAG: HemK family protein methyltransferase, partial [Bacteriovoracaceae bacterium]
MLLDRRHSFFQNLLRGIPLQYLLREAHFFNSRFYVNEDVLIPRSETELLVEDALDLIRQKKYQSVADIGTGSGCVALSLLTESNEDLRVFAVDIDQKALDVCAVNAFRLANKKPRGSSLELLLGDRVSPLATKVDLIATNPPYIDEDAD